MRLIDADNIYGAEDFIKLDKNGNAYVSLADICKIIDIQPTAYDVDKVIKGLNEWAFNANIDVGDGTVMNHNLIVRDVAIDIVKAGGNA